MPKSYGNTTNTDLPGPKEANVLVELPQDQRRGC